MANLSDLLKNLGSDADLAAAYEKDPHRVLADYELSDAEKQALLAGDVDAVQRACGLKTLSFSNGTVKAH